MLLENLASSGRKCASTNHTHTNPIHQKHTRSEHIQLDQETTQSFVPGVHSAKSHLDKSQPVPFVKIAAAPHRLRVPLGKDPMSVGYATLEPECWPN